jgi:hypothetical protein
MLAGLLTSAAALNVFRFVPGYETNVVATGKEPLLLLIVSFVVTFTMTRVYTRLARTHGWGSGSVGGVHVHHMVFGIVIVLLSGLVAIAIWPDGIGREIIAVCFGAGAALTLDEFALSFYLRDVYWTPEGRTSIDATLTGIMIAALLFIGVSPFGIHDDTLAPRLVALGVIVVNVALAAVTFLKGKLVLGLGSIFVPLLGLVGATRLATPGSPWARWFYRTRPEKLARSRERFQADATSRTARFNRWSTDLIGGRPSEPSPLAHSPRQDA